MNTSANTRTFNSPRKLIDKIYTIYDNNDQW